MAGIDRRQLVVAAGALSLATTARAQQDALEPPDVLSRVFADRGERLAIVHGVITMNLIFTVQLMNPASLAQSAVELENYIAQLLSFEGEAQFRQFVAAIASADFAPIAATIASASGKAAQNLAKAGSPEAVSLRVTRDFRRMSQVLYVKSKDNDHWWCKCYGLKLLC